MGGELSFSRPHQIVEPSANNFMQNNNFTQNNFTPNNFTSDMSESIVNASDAPSVKKSFDTVAVPNSYRARRHSFPCSLL